MNSERLVELLNRCGAERSARLLDGLKSLEAQPSVSALLALIAA